MFRPQPRRIKHGRMFFQSSRPAMKVQREVDDQGEKLPQPTTRIIHDTSEKFDVETIVQHGFTRHTYRRTGPKPDRRGLRRRAAARGEVLTPERLAERRMVI